jgi:hypothetical protein
LAAMIAPVLSAASTPTPSAPCATAGDGPDDPGPGRARRASRHPVVDARSGAVRAHVGDCNTGRHLQGRTGKPRTIPAVAGVGQVCGELRRLQTAGIGASGTLTPSGGSPAPSCPIASPAS